VLGLALAYGRLVQLAVQLVFLTLRPTYVLLGLGKAVDSDLLFRIGGAFGMATRRSPGTRRARSPPTRRSAGVVLRVGEAQVAHDAERAH
jgi:hypothetical protein